VIKLSNNNQITLSEPKVASIQLPQVKDDATNGDSEYDLISTVALVDIEQVWLDAQRDLQVAALSTVDDESGQGNEARRVVPVATLEIPFTQTTSGDKVYSGMECDKDEANCAGITDTDMQHSVKVRKGKGNINVSQVKA